MIAEEHVEVWHPSGVRSSLASVTGGLRCAPTTGYFLATLRVVSPESNVSFPSDQYHLRQEMDQAIPS